MRENGGGVQNDADFHVLIPPSALENRLMLTFTLRFFSMT